jgi:glycosyltransferase involved in cell wall biosynthesis
VSGDGTQTGRTQFGRGKYRIRPGIRHGVLSLPARAGIAKISGKLPAVQRRILLLITDLQIGGTPTVVRELAVRLHGDADFDVHVACLDRWGPVADQLRDRGVPVTALNACCRFDPGVLFRLIGLIRRERIDTVFSFLIHANGVAALASLAVPGVRFVQSIQTTQPNPRWHWRLQHVIQHAAEKIVVPTPSVKEAAIRWAGVKPERLFVIPNAVRIRDFSGERRGEKQSRRVAFIGRLDPIKRIGDLVTAVSLLNADIVLDIWGEGSQRGEIQSTIARLGLQNRAILHGAVAGSAEALENADVLVLPSDAEGFGLVLIEAMAAGVPVIGTNVPGIRDVIEDGISGLLVPPRNPRALANAIARVLSDVLLREKLIAGGRDRVRRLYDWEVCYGEYRQLLLGY